MQIDEQTFVILRAYGDFFVLGSMDVEHQEVARVIRTMPREALDTQIETLQIFKPSVVRPGE